MRRMRQLLLARNSSAMTDAELLDCFVSYRDEDAFEILVRRHGPMVLGVCRRTLRNSHDVEDAFQATFIVLVRKAADIRAPGQLANWLYGVAQRTALKARAAAGKRQSRERQGEFADPVTSSCDDDTNEL